MGTLDGLTILRFTHAGRSGGGIEQYLDDLDRILLTRNNVEIIRMYLEEELKGEKKIVQRIGQGNLILIPLEEGIGTTRANSNKQKIRKLKRTYFKKLFRDFIVYNPLLYHVFFREVIKKRFPRPIVFGGRNAREAVVKIFQEYDVDLILMHYIGGIDSAEIIDEAKKRKIPYIFLNHFSNDVLNNISVREQLYDAAGIAGVSGIGVPKRLRGNFHNLSDGIDTEIFNSDNACSPGIKTELPIIIYPARIVRVKGQSDLIKAYAKIKCKGLRARIVFAGRTDSLEYEEELKELAAKNGVTNDVLFAGQLNGEELRGWYGISSILGFPTYHNEGLPRILMEAQAMKITPIAYDVGGLSEGIQPEKTGFLVRKGDIRTFTKRLEYLLTNEKKREKMGEEGRKFIENTFSLRALAERHEKYYLRVLKNIEK